MISLFQSHRALKGLSESLSVLDTYQVYFLEAGKAPTQLVPPVTALAACYLVLSRMNFTFFPDHEIIQTSQLHPIAGVRGYLPTLLLLQPLPLLVHPALCAVSVTL